MAHDIGYSKLKIDIGQLPFALLPNFTRGPQGSYHGFIGRRLG